MADEKKILQEGLGEELQDIASIGETALAQDASLKAEQDMPELTPAQAAIALHHPELQKKLNEAQKKSAFSSMMAAIGQGIRYAGQAAASAGGGKIGAGEAVYQMQMSQADQPLKQVMAEEQLGMQQRQADLANQSAELGITQRRQELAFKDPTSKVNRQFQQQIAPMVKDNQYLKSLLPYASIEDWTGGKGVAGLFLGAEQRMKEQAEKTKAQMGLAQYKAELDSQRSEQEWANKFALQAAKDKSALQRKRIGAAAATGTRLSKEGTKGLTDAMKGGLADVAVSLRNISQEIDLDGEGELESLGPIMNAVPDALIMPAAKLKDAFTGSKTDLDQAYKVRGAVSQLRNALLKARSGGAVSDGEAMRLENELAFGPGMQPEQIRDALRRVRDTLDARIKAMGIIDPNSQKAFEQATGYEVGGNKPVSTTAAKKTVKMKFPDGDILDVPIDEVEDAKKQAGGKVVK